MLCPARASLRADIGAIIIKSLNHATAVVSYKIHRGTRENQEPENVARTYTWPPH